MASCGRLAIGLRGVDEKPHRPDTIRPQDAILPHNALRASSQQSAFSVQLLNQSCDCWLGALTAGGLYKIVVARKEYEG
jgi:hypothetical protein